MGEPLAVRRKGHAVDAPPGEDVGHRDGPGRFSVSSASLEFLQLLLQIRELFFQLGNLLLFAGLLGMGQARQGEQSAGDHRQPKHAKVTRKGMELEHRRTSSAAAYAVRQAGESFERSGGPNHGPSRRASPTHQSPTTAVPGTDEA